MVVVPRIEVIQYDGTNSASILTTLNTMPSYSGGTWSIVEEDLEGVVFKIFYEEYNEGIYPKLAPGDYVLITSQFGSVNTVPEDKLLDWYVVVAE